MRIGADSEHPQEVAVASRLHVLSQPLGHIVRIAADDKPRLAQFLEWCAWGWHLSPTGTLAIVKRAVGLNPWHRSGHLHRAAKGGETAHIHHRITALGDGLLRRLGDVEIARANAMLWAGHPAKVLLSDFLVVLERILEDGCRAPH